MEIHNRCVLLCTRVNYFYIDLELCCPISGQVDEDHRVSSTLGQRMG
jgi:hypothetical protein